MKIVGYGICGPGEATKYMRETMEEFSRLCDETIILCNNVTEEERSLIYQYGFKLVEDNREWGINQWKIKQDFLEKHVAKLKPDFCVCLDMDETLSPTCTREWIKQAPLDAYHVFVVDLWNDEQHYRPDSCFWNVRLFRWNGETKFRQKPVHCGLAPEWAYYYHRFAPFLLIHKGLMAKEDRMRKVKRYEQYDPNAKHLDRKYYTMLKSDNAVSFNEEDVRAKIEKEVSTYQQTKPKKMTEKKPERFAYVKNQHGVVLDVPEKHLAETLKRKGFEFVEWAEDATKEMEDLFEGVPLTDNEDVKLEEDGTVTAGDMKEQAEDIAAGNAVKIPKEKKVAKKAVAKKKK